MNLSESRERPVEQERIRNIIGLAPPGKKILDVGARDGYLSRLLTDKYDEVTALDLVKPQFTGDRIITIAGNAASLEFPDNYFDSVICAEVLEHIPSPHLEKACSEICRVAQRNVVIGVPYKQDTRVGRTTCLSCGRKNPPWGHVNEFDESRLRKLFEPMQVQRQAFIGSNDAKTNIVSTFLMDLAGNPYGTYTQEEHCVYCDSKLVPPGKRSICSKVLGKVAINIDRIQKSFSSATPNWIHMHFVKHLP